MSRIYVFIFFLVLCFVLVPVVSYFLGGWFAYWGHALLAVLFAVLVVFVKTRYYWEEE